MKQDFLAFSCLYGTEKGLEDNLGSLFTPKKTAALQKFLHGEKILVLVDDLEPARIWLWETPQEEITEWLRLVLESSPVPEGWEVRLWSEIECQGKHAYEQILNTIRTPKYALHVHRLYEYMKEFPNKKAKLEGNKAFKEAAFRRAAHYALQGAILEDTLPKGVLVQTETPRQIKDPLFQPFRSKSLEMVYPFEERR